MSMFFTVGHLRAKPWKTGHMLISLIEKIMEMHWMAAARAIFLDRFYNVMNSLKSAHFLYSIRKSR